MTARAPARLSADILGLVELLFTSVLLVSGLAVALLAWRVAYRLYTGQR